jgi:hypothetical protein
MIAVFTEENINNPLQQSAWGVYLNFTVDVCNVFTSNFLLHTIQHSSLCAKKKNNKRLRVKTNITTETWETNRQLISTHVNK